MFIAYVIRRISTGRVIYVGITTRSLRRRWWEHQWHGGSTRLTRAIAKHGADAFEVEAVASGFDRASLADLETLLILQYGTLSPAGCNLTTGGEGHYTRSEETRNRMSQAFTGRIFSAEHRAKLGARRRGIALTAAHKAKVGRPGRPQSPDLIAKRAAAQIGRVMSAATRAKISAAKTGKSQVRSPETVEKARASLIVHYASMTFAERQEHMRPAYSARHKSNEVKTDV